MKHKLNILLAEDDERDLELITLALRGNGVPINIQRVQDGEQAMHYLQGQEPFADRLTYPFPDLMILDLKLPRFTGLEVLLWRKNHPQCARVPVVVFSGSSLPRDINDAYSLGANSYFTKPDTAEELRDIRGAILHYWSSAQLPEMSNQRVS